jgi:hypothetical protein
VASSHPNPKRPARKIVIHPPQPKFGGIVGERLRIRKHVPVARTAQMSRRFARRSRFELHGGWYSWVGSNHRPPVPQKERHNRQGYAGAAVITKILI